MSEIEKRDYHKLSDQELQARLRDVQDMIDEAKVWREEILKELTKRGLTPTPRK